MRYSFQQVAEVIGDLNIINNSDAAVEYISTDSRRIIFPQSTLFFALTTTRKDAHEFISDLVEQGVINFVVHSSFNHTLYKNANFILVDDTLNGLQQLAAHHRSKFTYPVIGITGSNGKTVMKEWLYQLLSPDYNIVRSPRSYNSQIGVPLSVWLMNEENNLAIFEAGISQPGEMPKLEKIIQPTIGVFTNIGEAHSENFRNRSKKALEKLQLFRRSKALIYPTIYEEIDNNLVPWKMNDKISFFQWGKSVNNKLEITSIKSNEDTTSIAATYNKTNIQITIPFTDNASVENAINCWCVCLYLKLNNDVIIERMLLLQPVEMRLQLINGINNCAIINDSYSFDLGSFGVALDFLHQQTKYTDKSVILSDIPGAYSDMLYKEAVAMLQARSVKKVIAIGEYWQNHKALLSEKFETVEYFISTNNFLQQFAFNQLRNEAVLLKGSRSFTFEKIAAALQQRVHQTVMEINLSALIHNLNEYRKHLLPSTKIMAMVKAFAYGSGSTEAANVLQFHKVDYLAVAYADEGIDLRRSGIRVPIMVMNIDEAAFETVVQYNLEPELYSINIATAFDAFINRQGLQQYPVHIKLDTGMHRLGFEETDMDALLTLLTKNNRLLVRSVFTHFVASDDAAQNDFTQLQFEKYVSLTNILQQQLSYSFIQHIANSAGVLRKPEYQLNMVRLGIGLYGIDPSNQHILNLQNVPTLKTTVAQLRHVQAGDTVGYSRKGKLNHDAVIATLRIGYADGFRRALSNGKGSVYINGQLAPVVGLIAMDMTMVDVTNIDVQEGDEAEIFGGHISVTQLAATCETIPYEILTGVSQRVKRIYQQDEL